MSVDDLGIDIADLPLPSGISIDSTAPATPGDPHTRTGFSVTSTIPAISRPLSTQCPSCPSATAPKPAFTAPPATVNVNLTAGSSLQSATLIAGSQIQAVINNGFTFDPINPPGGTAGTITITISNGTANLATRVLQGGVPADALPAGQSKTITIPLSGSFNTSSPITVSMTMDSPAGSAVAMSPSHTFTVTPTATLRISTATVSIAANTIDPSTSDMDLLDLDDMVKRIEDVDTPQGAMLLEVTNPMSLGANAVLHFTGTKTIKDGESEFTRPMTAITKNVVLPVGGGATTTSTVTVPFTGKELREMLGSTMVVTFSGNTVAGTTVVTPTSRISATGRMRLRLFVKEIEE